MKSSAEIAENRRIQVLLEGEDGGQGIIALPQWRGTVIWSTGAGWEHVSVSPEIKRIVPTWDDMCKIKDIFFGDDEAVIQIHPPKDEYVNIMPNCLHLWRCSYKEMVLPPSCLVGIRKGQTMEELNREIREAYEIAGETI